MQGKFFSSAVLTEVSELPRIDTSEAHIARVYDYWLGGKDNISQVVSVTPHSGRIVPIQARHSGYSKTELLTRV